MAHVQTANADGTNITVRMLGDSNILVSEVVKNATGRTIIQGQKVLIHYREGALTPSDPAYITSILTGAID